MSSTNRLLNRLFYYSFLAFSTVCLLNCSNTPPVEVETSAPIYYPLEDSFLTAMPLPLKDGHYIRTAPIKTAKVVALSDSSNLVLLEGKSKQYGHWFLCKMGTKKGWVHLDATEYSALPEDASLTPLFLHLFEYEFGTLQFLQLKNYQRELSSIKTIPGFATVFQRALRLQDSLNSKISSPANKHKTYHWLSTLLPNFRVSYSTQNPSYNLYKDYKAWAQLAQQTASKQDDAFINLYLTLFSSDSIEYWHNDLVFPLQDTDTVLCSRLGSGTYIKLFDQIAKDSSWGYFQEEIIVLRKDLIQQIVESKSFWFASEQVDSSLQTILAHKRLNLSKPDAILLSAKRKQLERQSDYNLVLNVQEAY